MATVNKNLLVQSWLPLKQFVRYRKINIQKPFPPHFVRAVVENVCQPYFKPRDPLAFEMKPCNKTRDLNNKKIENPYVTLLAKDLLNWLTHSKMTVFFHRGPLQSEEIFEARLMLHKLGMKMKLHGRGVVTAAVQSTPYEAILSLYQGETAIAFGPNDNVQGLLKGLKKTPKLVLIGGIIDNRLLNRAEIERIASLGDLPSAQAGLVALLQSPSLSLVQNMQQHQQQLVSHLDAIKNRDEPS